MEDEKLVLESMYLNDYTHSHGVSTITLSCAKGILTHNTYYLPVIHQDHFHYQSPYPTITQHKHRFLNTQLKLAGPQKTHQQPNSQI